MYPSAILRGSPPSVGTRKTFHSVPSLRLKRMEPPSGEKDGSASGPLVSATSAPSGSCLSQMQRRSAAVRDERERLAVRRNRRLRVASGVRQRVERRRLHRPRAEQDAPEEEPIASARSAAPAAARPGHARGGGRGRERGGAARRDLREVLGEVREVAREVARRGIAVVGVLREAALRDPARGGGRLRRGGGEGLGLVADDRGERLGGRVLLEGAAAGEHLVEDRAERELVRPEVRRTPRGLLGRHVPDCPHHGARLRAARALRDRLVVSVAERRERLREAEVEELRAPLLRDDHVLGLEVAVHDAARVRRRERVGDLGSDREGAAEGNRLWTRRSRSVAPSTSSMTRT